MTIRTLKDIVTVTIENLKNHGMFPKENNLYDYKLELNFFGLTDAIEIFCRNFAKDILSFSSMANLSSCEPLDALIPKNVNWGDGILEEGFFTTPKNR
jgi:hypothetical protein